MGRRNKPRRRPQADKRVRLVGMRHTEIDQRKLGRAVLRLLAIEAGQTPPESARSGPNAPEPAETNRPEQAAADLAASPPSAAAATARDPASGHSRVSVRGQAGP
jgi:hypothetical protein